MSVIKLTEAEWAIILANIEKDNKPGTLLLRYAMQRELGFTVRRHRFWLQEKRSYDGYGEWVEEIHLDFVDEAKATLFRLKHM